MFPTHPTSARMLAHRNSHCFSLRCISWLVNLYDLFTHPRPLSSTCHSSFIIKEVPGGHTAVVCLLLFCCAVCCSTCLVDMNDRVVNKALLSAVFWKGEVVVWKGMQLSILSQLLPWAAAAKHLFPGSASNSCSPPLSVKPISESGISFIPLCWMRV